MEPLDFFIEYNNLQINKKQGRSPIAMVVIRGETKVKVLRFDTDSTLRFLWQMFGSCSSFGLCYPFPKMKCFEDGINRGEVSMYFPKHSDEVNYVQAEEGADVIMKFRHQTNRRGVDLHYELARGLLHIHVRYKYCTHPNMPPSLFDFFGAVHQEEGQESDTMHPGDCFDYGTLVLVVQFVDNNMQ